MRRSTLLSAVPSIAQACLHVCICARGVGMIVNVRVLACARRDVYKFGDARSIVSQHRHDVGSL